MNREIIDYGKRFHGHLGPFMVIGLKMGILALERLGNPDSVHTLSCIVELENRRPISCVIDGIQVSSGCTLGKGNITVREGRGVEAVFKSNGRELKIRLKEGVMERILGMFKEVPGEQAAERIIEMPNEELFEVEYAKH